MNEELWKIIADSDSVLGEVMTGGQTSKTNAFNYVVKTKRRNAKVSRSDLYLRLCDKCDYVWEKEFSSFRLNNNNNKIKYICKYEEIPKYKKPVETCLICLGEPNVEERKIY
jgi:hypothetical protein